MIRSHIRQHQLLAFVFVTFGWTWSWDALYYAFGLWETLPTTLPRQWGVPLGALVVVAASERSLRAWLSTVFQWRVHPGLYLVAVLIPLGITNVQPVVRAVGGGSLGYAPPASLPVILLFVLVNAVVLGGIEEVGWRGFLQPRVQERTSVLTAGMGIGVLWWAWHLPLFLGHPNFVLDPVPFAEYTVFVIGASTVFGAVVNATNGGVVPLMAMHGTTNLGPLLEGSGGILDGTELLPLVVGSGAWWLLVFVLLLLFGRSMVPVERVI